MSVELESSRTESKQARRMRAVWGAARPSEAQIERAHRRFRQRALPRRRPFRLVFIAAAQGFVVGVVSLASASFVANRVLPALGSRDGAASLQALEAPRIPRRPPAAPAVSSPVQLLPGDGDTAHESSKTMPSVTPGTASGRDGPPRSAPHASTNATETARTGSSQEPPSGGAVTAGGPIGVDPAGSWARVARALTESDLGRADAALAELAKSEDPTTRDAAALARAELFIAHGGGAGFRNTVVRLAATGSTPLIRKRARELLSRFP